MFVENQFTEFKLSAEEVRQGSILPVLTRKVIQNLRAQCAQQMLGVTFDPLNPVQAALEHASLSGMLSALDTVIGNSDSAYKELTEKAAAQSRSQRDNDNPSA